MSLKNFRAEFPLLQDCIYADTAANGLLSKKVMEWRREHDRDFLQGGQAMKLDSGKVFEQLKTRLANLFNCGTEQVGLVQNFSVGFNFILEGIKNTCNVLLLEDEYPSVSWPVHSRNFKTQVLPLSNNLENNVKTALRKGEIDLLAVSMVQYISGLMLSPEFFKELREEFPELLIAVDGTQYCGAYRLDFPDSGIDIMGCSGYKWLLGGYGNGFFLFRPGVFDKLQLKATGFNAARGDIASQFRFKPTRHLEPGHLDQLSFGSLNQSLSLLETVGWDLVENQNKELSQRVYNGLAELGLLDKIALGRNRHSTIFNIPFSEKRWDVLREAGVISSQRGGGIRLSFHAYNQIDEIDAILSLLKKAG